MMNPIEGLKAIYETFGTPHPRASLIAVMILGAASFGAVWVFAAKQVEKSRVLARPPQVSGPATTTGDESPANTGSGNEFNYGDRPAQKKQKPGETTKP
jgi:hypothetical protein